MQMQAGTMVNHNAAAANFCHGRSFRDNPQISIETMTHLIKCDFAANLKSSHGNHLPLVYVLRDGPEMMAYISNLSLWPKIFFYEVEKPDAVSIPKENIVPAGQGQSVQDWLGTFSREDPDVRATIRREEYVLLTLVFPDRWNRGCDNPRVSQRNSKLGPRRIHRRYRPEASLWVIGLILVGAPPPGVFIRHPSYVISPDDKIGNHRVFEENRPLRVKSQNGDGFTTFVLRSHSTRAAAARAPRNRHGSCFASEQ